MLVVRGVDPCFAPSSRPPIGEAGGGGATGGSDMQIDQLNEDTWGEHKTPKRVPRAGTKTRPNCGKDLGVLPFTDEG